MTIDKLDGGNNNSEDAKNIAYLRNAPQRPAFDIEAALSNVIGDDTPELTSEHDLQPGGGPERSIADIIASYSYEKTISLFDFMQYYTVNELFAPQCFKMAGDLEISKPSNVFYVVAQLKEKDERILAKWPESIVVTTIKTKDQQLSFLNSLKTKLQHANGGVTAEIYTTSIYDVVNMIDSMKSVMANPNRHRFGDAETKVESRAQAVFREIVMKALKLGASDIHIIHRSNVAYIKFTIAGVIVPQQEMDKNLANRLVAASLFTTSPEYGAMASDAELADARLVDKYDVEREIVHPNGRKEIITVKEQVTLRVGKSPSDYGPHTTMRILRETTGVSQSLDSVGYDADNLRLLRNVLEKPSGILLMTGPTGSGKTTTLACCYEEIPKYKKIIVLEDPIEIKLSHPNAVQSAVQPENRDKDYNAFLRKALRQAPNVIGMAEIRDSEVALACFRAAMTGHLMISTIHTNGSIETIVRLNDLGITYGVMAVAGILDTIAAQRLLRRLCVHCRIPYKDENPKVGQVFKACEEGCDHCVNGYLGRVLVCEVLVFDDKIREFVTKPNNTSLIRQYLKSKGWRSMADRALEKVHAGLIDVIEAKSQVQGFLDESSEMDYTKNASEVL